MAFTEDMSVFFNTDEFAVEASYTPSGGGATQTAKVLLDMPSEDVLSQDSLSIEYSIMFPYNVLTTLKKGEQIAVDGVAYKVRDVRPMTDYRFGFLADGRVKRALLSKI
jgi:hypothetical protein